MGITVTGCRLGSAPLQVCIQGHQQQSVEGDAQALGFVQGLLVKRFGNAEGKAVCGGHGGSIAWRQNGVNKAPE